MFLVHLQKYLPAFNFQVKKMENNTTGSDRSELVRIMDIELYYIGQFLYLRFDVNVISQENFSLRTVEKIGHNLGYLYLSGLHLRHLPSFIFTRIPNLKWLDVRDNRIMGIPSEISSHQRLQVKISIYYSRK